MHLKYAYLVANNTLPDVISSTLDSANELSLLQVLKKYIRVIGWTLVDIRVISPYCITRSEIKKDL